MPMSPPSSSPPPPAGTSSSGAGNRQKPSRLQRRAPPLKITPAPATATAGAWNAAIPLLSPLAASPTPSSAAAALDQLPPPPPPPPAVEEKMPVFKKWQHPAAPFYYETASFVPPFVPVQKV